MNTVPRAEPSKIPAGGDHGSSEPDPAKFRSRPAHQGILAEKMLAGFESRAATYDRENRFFDQDFEELRATKYLLLPVSRDLGGFGLSLAESCREQRRLAYYAPATALAVNMHLYWIGVAAELQRRGDT